MFDSMFDSWPPLSSTASPAAAVSVLAYCTGSNRAIVPPTSYRVKMPPVSRSDPTPSNSSDHISEHLETRGVVSGWIEAHQDRIADHVQGPMWTRISRHVEANNTSPMISRARSLIGGIAFNSAMPR